MCQNISFEHHKTYELSNIDENHAFWGQIPKISLKIHYFFSKIVKSENQNSAAPRGLRGAPRTPRRAAEEIRQF